MTQHYPVVVERESNGTFSAWVADLPGVYAAADTAAVAKRGLEQAPEHLVRVEVLLGDLARSAAVAWVVSIQLLDGGQHVVFGLEGEEAPAGGKKATEAGVLRDHRTARGEVTVVNPPAAPVGSALPEVLRIVPDHLE